MRSALLAAVIAAAAVQAAPSPIARRGYDNHKLRFRPDGSFHLTVFNDLHFGEKADTAEGPRQDEKTINVMNNVLDSDPVDLVVLNGDLISGDASQAKNMSGYVDDIVQPMMKRGTFWASTYGNHDSSQTLDPRNILEREKQHPGALTERMVMGRDAGVTNYWLPVYASNCTKEDSSDDPCAPNLLLWFFDSRGGKVFGATGEDGKPVPRADWVDRDVVRWFRKESVRLRRKYRKVIPSLAFVHIPTNATSLIQRKVKGDQNPGINDETPVSPQAQDWCPDGTWGGGNPNCRYGGQDVPFMQALSGTEGLLAVFSGHDHGNTWCRRWREVLPGTFVRGNNIHLCYGQHAGYGGYGDWVRGGRHIVVTEEMLQQKALQTWIRLETKNVVGRVTLNSTFNEDRYAVTSNDKTHL
ncbi:hypothetical protein JDV02_000410 [Purpureocillium takamizusanense]|uniref:Calcineurin-like phosphoesterase domain-containing protein n=1 Tax=Purpureocillium takamizusanense TaxID=2060973 RepID=A0A9Q8Q4T2_9HYPO|nr:uncharacterized protein JDV02_000410 [Purpureocillium takamizusanense]UNI13688.1 hypothetical protein JDV02_000410 [Purpureocillium takamizusanense]